MRRTLGKHSLGYVKYIKDVARTPFVTDLLNQSGLSLNKNKSSREKLPWIDSLLPLGPIKDENSIVL